MDQTSGIGKRTQRATTGRNFKTGCSKSTEIHQRQYRAPTKKKRVCRFFYFLLKIGLKNYFEGIQSASRALLLVTDAPRKENANT